MASVSVRRRNSATDQREGRSGWVVAWREPGGRQRRKAFARKADAERFATTVRAALLDGTYIDPSAARITFGALAATWQAGQVQLTPATAARYADTLATQILPRWAEIPLGRVTHSDVQAWIADLLTRGGRGGGPLAPRSVVKAHLVFARILDLAVKDRRIASNPARGVELPRGKQTTKRFLTVNQVDDLSRAIEALAPAHGLDLVVETLAWTGLRFGDLAALRVRDFDALRRRLHVERSVTDVGGVMVFGEPKTHQHRQVPVPRFLVARLAAHLAGTGRRGEDLLFVSPAGEVLRANNFRRRHFEPAAAAVGLGGLTPHELRHTAASLAVESGANVKAVARMLGHASAAMTLDVYAGLFEDHLDAVADRMEEIAARARRRPAATASTVTPIR